MITFLRRVPHKRSVPGGDDPDENIALVLFEEGSIARWHTAAQAETVRESDHSRPLTRGKGQAPKNFAGVLR